MSIRSLDLATKQGTLTRELSARGMHVSGSVKLLLNAVFVRVPRGAHPNFANLPGVKYAAYLPPMKRHLNDAVALVQVNPGAWSNARIGGVGNAGAGIKIGIIDSGLDDLNPALNDASLTIPSGYPLGESAYTNHKIIVARSYVANLSSTDPQYSSPDDLSPVDRVGHGTAVAMIAAGGTTNGPAVTISTAPLTITGVAPKAWIGNYKIFGSPGVNDFTSGSAVIQALEDAANDGMNIVTLAIGDSAVTAPLDTDCAANGQSTKSYIPVTSCDVQAQAVENAVNGFGMTVVVSAGDSGASGNVYPTLGTITSPGTAPSAITVGATTNAHDFDSTVYVSGNGVPANQFFEAEFGSGPKPLNALTAVVTDITKFGNDGTACSALPANSLNGAMALVLRGTCDFATKANNVQAAGAVGLLLYLDNPNDGIFVPVGLATTAIPTALIANADGLQLKTYALSNSITVTLDPTLYEVSATQDQIALFSSRGPSIGLFSPTPVLSVKPEIVAPGSGIYTATETLDPNGDLYDPSGFNVAQGTSFAVPLVAGAVALVKQANPGFTAAQLKSAMVNTATENVTDNGVPADLNASGAGKLDAADALNVTITCVPSTLSFGVVNGSAASGVTSQSFTITNVSSAPIPVTLSVDPYSSGGASVTLSTPTGFTLGSGLSSTVSVQLSGSASPGSYQGEIDIMSSGPKLHVPYLYLVTDSVPSIIFSVAGDGLLNSVGSIDNTIAIRVLDQFGVPIGSTSGVSWKVDGGAGLIQSGAETTTDQYGIASAQVTLASQPEAELFEGDIGSVGYQFGVTASNSPAIQAVVNAGNSTKGSFAPGSYLTIYGTNLSPTSNFAKTTYLPLSLSTTSVSFDVPSEQISVPGALSYVSPTQVNVQIPWELQNQAGSDRQSGLGWVAQLHHADRSQHLLTGFLRIQRCRNKSVDCRRHRPFLSGDRLRSSGPARPVSGALH